MGYSLEVSVLGLLSTCLLWEGVQCDISKYTLNAPTVVTVPEGLCVIIPCNFTYDPDDAVSTSTLYGYWYIAGSNSKIRAVATNNRTKPIEDYARNRFTLSEEVAQGNCSLIINDAKKIDEKKYYFRVEKYRDAKLDYTRFAQPTVNIINLENPEIMFWGDLRAEQPVNITCTAPGSCSLKPPHIFWKEIPREITPRSSEMQSNGSQVYISVLDFIPSRAVHGKELTCSVSYGGGVSLVSKERTVLLNIRYPPLIQQIDVEVTHGNDSLINLTDTSQTVVDQGDSVTLHCKAEGNPLPCVTWVKQSQSLGTSHLTNHSELILPGVEIQDVGTYKCQAWNSEGSASKTLELSIREVYASGHFSSAVPLLVVLCLIKVLFCFLFFFFIISFSTQRKAQLRKKVTMGMKRPDAPVAPEEEK